MAIHCGKRTLILTWGILECVFFSGILNGWIWLKQILKEDHYFVENCNITTQASHVTTVSPRTLEYNNGQRLICVTRWIKVVLDGPIVTPAVTTPNPILNETTKEISGLNLTDPVCLDQDEQLELVISLIFIIRNILMLPFGIFIDRYGTSRTRIFAITFLAFGSLMMLFSNNRFPWLGLPALILLSVSGLLILLTDIQIANLFGTRRYTVMSMLVGAYHSGGLILYLMKVNRDKNISIQTSFMFMAVGIVPVLISTIALLPTSRIPWPLPLNYGKSKYSSNMKEERYQPKNWQRRISAGEKVTKESSSLLFSVLKSSMYLWLLVWFTIISLKVFLFDMNIDLILLDVTENNKDATQYINVYGILMLFSLPLSPIIGVVMDWRKSFVTDPKTDQMINIVHALVATYVISLLSGITSLLPLSGFLMISCVLVTIEKVAALSTLFAILTHVHFPSECFGTCIGLVLCFSGLAMVLQFAFKIMIRETFQNQFFYVNLIVLLLQLFAAGHPINVWYNCRRGHIKDTSISDQTKSVTIKLVTTGNDQDETESVIENAPCDTKTNTVLQVTDL